jgi:thiol-disulfide isomerase/thioredoxin
MDYCKSRLKRTWLVATLILFVPVPALFAAEPLDFAAYKGKVVVVDFWASWCVPCRRSFPWLNAMHDKYGNDGLVIVGVNLDTERAEADAFLLEYPAKFHIYFDESKSLAKEFDVVAMPSSYVLGPDGEIRTRHFGFKVKNQAEYEARIIEALQSLE